MANTINKSWDPGFYISPTGLTVVGSIKTVDTYDILIHQKYPSRFVWVKDASGDPTVNSGSALYTYRNGQYEKIYETESMDQNAPSGGGETNSITREEWNRLTAFVNASADDIARINSNISSIETRFDNYVLITTFNSEVNRLDGRIDSCSTTISGVNEQLQTHLANHPTQPDLTSIETSISTLESTVAEHDNTINTLVASIGGGIIVDVASLTNNKLSITTANCLPIAVKTASGNIYRIENGSMTVSGSGWLIDPTSYLAYDNVASFSGTWKIYCMKLHVPQAQ